MKCFVGSGLGTCQGLIDAVDKAGGVRVAFPINPQKAGGANSHFRNLVAENLIGFREHAAELDKLPPPELPEGEDKARARKRKTKKSAPVGKQPPKSVGKSDIEPVEPTTFRHRGKRVAETVVSNKWQMLDVYAEIAEVGLALRKLVDMIKDTPEIAKLRCFITRKATQDQLAILEQQFDWMIRPAGEIVTAVDDVLAVK